jgi:RNA recognition motif-containing protein
MNIFVGNLSFDAVEADLKKLFEGFGNVASVVIVMRKEKKVPKSRGFGFVDMPDEQQALAAMAALNGKEFMGRVLNVNPARPKTEVGWKSDLKKKRHPKVETEAEQHPREEREQKKSWFSPVFNKPGTYRGGRRTRSYMKRRGLAGMQEEAKPRRRSQDNPMRWRKKKPWQKSPGEHKPWEKAKEGARPWKKSEGESKPWRKSEGGIKPWKKPAGDAKPWSKSSGRPQKSRFKVRRKPGKAGPLPTKATILR